jgi:uncharacterized membrane protein (DUF106 family)
MKRIAAFMLLAASIVAWSIPAKAQRTSVEQENERQYQKGAKTQRKMLNKANKKQRKAMKKSEKQQRKAAKTPRHRTQ